MATNPPASLPAALTGALGAINNTKASIKAAAAEVYTPPADQAAAPAEAPVTAPKGP